MEDGQTYASLRHMCQALGLDFVGQRQRVERHEILNDGKGVCKLQAPVGSKKFTSYGLILFPCGCQVDG